MYMYAIGTECHLGHTCKHHFADMLRKQQCGFDTMNQTSQLFTIRGLVMEEYLTIKLPINFLQFSIKTLCGYSLEVPTHNMCFYE